MLVTYGDLTRVLDSLELELQMVVSLQVGAGDRLPLPVLFPTEPSLHPTVVSMLVSAHPGLGARAAPRGSEFPVFASNRI